MKKYNFIKDVIVHHNQLIEMSYRISSEIKEFYQSYCEKSGLVVITVMDGGWQFARGVFSAGYLPSSFDITHHTVSAKSYGDDTGSSGTVKIEMGTAERVEEIMKDIKGKPIIVVDDIYDTGRTLNAVVSFFKKCSPPEIECCVMIERNCEHVFDINPKFVGVKVDTKEFLVGGGLDFEGEFRTLPYIGTVKPDFQGEHREEHICNKCGEPCASNGDKLYGEQPPNTCGLLNAVAKGDYFSPILCDGKAYRFDLCEKCLKIIFDNFTVPVTELDYDLWTGKVYE